MRVTKNFLNLLLLGAVLGMGLSACGPGNAPDQKRTFSTNDIPQATSSFQFEPSAIWPTETKGACARLEELAREPSLKRSRFAFLAAPFSYSVEANGEVTAFGRIDLSLSPLMQFVLTTPAVDEKVTPVLTSDDDEFLRLARERLKVDVCENQQPQTPECAENMRQWNGANLLKTEGLLYKEKPVAVMRELSGRFPGVFGDASEMKRGKDGAVSLLLLQRVGLFGNVSEEAEINPADAESILSVEVPLFPVSRSWQEWRRDTERSIPAAVAGISAASRKEERLCSLVLWQRMFAQLLSVKGYEGPSLTADGSLQIIQPGATALEKTKVNGAYVDRATNRAVILDPEEIPKYDPAQPGQKYLEGSAKTPLLRDPEAPQTGTLMDALDRLEAYSWIFSASSPATWGDDSTYFFGDLVETETAIAPFQTHSLALGLLLMGLKNLSETYIVPMDTERDIAVPSVSSNGMVLLTQGKASLANGEMRLTELARLTNTIVRLNDGLDRIYAMAERNPELLKRRSLVYSKEHKEGDPFYTEAKLKDLEVLRAALNRLLYPLAHRMIRMVEMPEGCVARESANWQAGGRSTRRTLETCTAEHIRDYKATMRILAHHTGSKVYYRKSL